MSSSWSPAEAGYAPDYFDFVESRQNTKDNSVPEIVTSKDIDQIGIPPRHMRLIQLVYDGFAATGQWPKSRSLQIAYMPDDFWSVVEEIDHHLLRKRGEKGQPNSRTSLSLEGIVPCSGSDDHLSLFVQSLQICIEIYTNNPESPLLTASHIQESLSLNENETQCAFELLFVADRIWSSASHSPEQQLTDLILSPDILRYSRVTDICQYLEVVRKNRPRKVENLIDYRHNMEVRNALLKAFSTLHPKIADRCEDLFQNEHYSESVEASFKVVRDRLRELTGHERGQDAFGRGNLHIAGAAAANVDKAFNEGVKFLLMAIDNFRNEKSHTSNDQINDPVHAYEYLRISSLAMRLLDRAEVSGD